MRPDAAAARVIVKAVARRRREVIATGHGKAIVWVATHMPCLWRPCSSGRRIDLARSR
jgi:hypothetical protein